MKLHGAPNYLIEKILTLDSGRALSTSANIKGQLLGYQAAALFELAKKYDGKPILEIGTFVGYSTSILAQACPNSHIITLNNAKNEIQDARKNLAKYSNATVLCTTSWDYLDISPFDLGFIFVDGDHVRVGKDLPWWNKLSVGGLMLFHDYSINEIYVNLAVDTMGLKFGREPDVSIIDTDKIGMAGFYKQDTDIL